MGMQLPPAQQRPTIVPRARRTGSDFWLHRLDRMRRNIVDWPGRALGILATNAIGVAISIAIIAAGDGIDTKIRDTLGKVSDANLKAAGVDIDTIHTVLTQTRNLLTVLAVIFTAAIVGLVTWISTSQRRRNIGLEVQAGQHRRDLIIELVGESFILCMAGGFLGVILGLILCAVIQGVIPLLPMAPNVGSVFEIFPVTTLLAFVTTAAIAAYFASHTDTRTAI